ncbi:MAG: hypothetical protein EOO92_27745, partial [Pedobacter sp.]
MRKLLLILLLFVNPFLSCTEKVFKVGQTIGEEEMGHFYKNEVKPEKEKPCFQGAYYWKLVSSHDAWVGINGVVKLPEIYFDAARIDPRKPAQYLD